MKMTPSRLLLGAALLASPALLALEPEQFRVRVSVKKILSPSGAVPTGRFGSTSEISGAFAKSNVALRTSGAKWTLILVEVEDSLAASDFYSMSTSDMTSLETRAKADPDGFLWRTDAINMYVADDITDAGGVCSFPGVGAHREVIAINSKGLLGGSEGWLHEIGHYFNLIHTHEGDLVADTINDPPLPDPFNCSVHDQNFLSQAQAAGASPTDIYNGLHNIMGYHCDPLVLTPLQIVRMERALLDSRLKVAEPFPEDGPPIAEIRLPPEAASGSVAFAGAPVEIVLDGSRSSDGDGGDAFSATWSVVSGPAAGAKFLGLSQGWFQGSTGIGYDDDDDLTVLSDMRNRYLTVYMTRALEVPDPSRLRKLELDIAYDDGFAAYLNGAEVARRNLPASAGPSTPAISSGDSREVIDLTSSLGLLAPGKNRISIEVHNATIDSSDLSAHPVLYAESTTGARTAIVPSRATWYYQKGSAGAPPADWKEIDFDPAATRGRLRLSKRGTYRLRLAVDDARPPDNVATADVEVTVGGDVFVRGDCNADASVDLSDAVRILLHLFSGAPAPPCLDACDADDDEVESITDAVVLLGYLFASGAPPAAPFPAAGVDPAGDGLGCGS